MRLKSVCAALAVVALMAVPAFAGTPSVGDEAPEVGEVRWVTDPPQSSRIADLRGEVIIIEKWGVNCPPCVRMIPHMQQLFEKYNGKGLHIFAIEAQNSSDQQILALLKARGANYPVCQNGAHNYNTGGGIPYMWIIGVDGKVIFSDNPYRGNIDQIIEAELRKVRFPGLGRAEVHDDVVKAAQKFAEGKLSDARDEAQKVIANENASEEAKADAKYVADRVTARAEGLLAEAKKFEDERRYFDAQRLYEQIKDTFGRNDAEYQSADERLKEFRRDRTIRGEIDAWEKWVALQSSLENERDPRRALAAVKGFAESRRYEGTRAQEEAKRAMAALEAATGGTNGTGR